MSKAFTKETESDEDDDLGLPPIVKEFALRQNGLVLLTGPTGSGKSTTMAAMLDIINNNRRCHIVTIEDPIEYVHQPVKSIIYYKCRSACYRLPDTTRIAVKLITYMASVIFNRAADIFFNYNTCFRHNLILPNLRLLYPNF